MGRRRGSALNLGLGLAWDLGGVGQWCGRDGSRAWVDGVGQRLGLTEWVSDMSQ